MSKIASSSERPVKTSPALRRFLYVTAGITGACILIVEILGAKMLSPFVGTSHFVWTAQIAVTLVSLAVGYYFGGWLVDRSAQLHRLFFCIAFAAVYLCFSLLIVEKVTYAFLNLNLALGALLSSATLFFIPLTLLAAVGPFFIRVLALSWNAIGSQVGRLSAISTLGSVLGTILIGYVLIPFLPNSVTMYLTAALLLGTSLVYFAVWNRPQTVPLLFLGSVGLGLGALGIRRDLTQGWPRVDELYRANSNFGMLQVIQTRGQPRRYYLNDYLVQNTYDPEMKKSTSLFTHMLRYLAEGYTTNLQDVLCIGMGVGIVPNELIGKGVRVDVVDINPAVVEVARRFFDFQPEKANVIIADGRYIVNRSTNRYDALLLDAFLGDSSPSHLMTREAFENMRRVLKPEGVLVINSFGDLSPGKNFFAASLFKTLSTVFKSVRAHGTGNGNLFFAASMNTNMALSGITAADAHPEVRSDATACLASILIIDPSPGRVLTDDFNPVEFYDAANRETHRRRLAFSLKRL
jgi:spermidine synthase